MNPSSPIVDKEQLNPFQDDVNYSDVIIVVEGRRLYLHSCILNKISSELKNMVLANLDEERMLRINVPDEIKLSVVINLLRFYYPMHNYDLENLIQPIDICGKCFF